MIQTNLRETDMADMDAHRFVRDLLDFNATAVLLNTGGILASYPSLVEDHTVCSYLTGSSLKEIIGECHSNGIKVIARMDFSKAREEVYLRHPDWAYRDSDGNIINYNGDVHMCISGDFGQKKSFEIMKEVLTLLDVDGVFFNMGGFKTVDYSYNYHGICHCRSCREKFLAFSGLELPLKEDMSDPVFRTYRSFQDRIVSETNGRLRSLIRSIRPDILIGGDDFIRTESKTEYRRERASWPYQSSSVARGGSSVEGSPLITNASVDFIGFLYRHNSVGAERMELRFNQDIANFCGLDYYIMGRLDNHLDRTSYSVVRDRFAYMKRHENIYRGMKLYSEALIIRNGGNDQLNDEAKGWIRVLTESHIPFGEVSPGVIDEDTDLSSFRLIVVPSLMKVPENLAKKLDEFVSRGGTLIVSGAGEFYDGNYRLYDCIPYRSLGGISVSEVRKNQISGMLRIHQEDRAVLPSLADTDVLYYGDDYASCSYPEGTERHLSLIPPHPFGPPERCYFTVESDEPGYVVRSHGKGKAIYIPWNPGKNIFLDGYLSTVHFLSDLVLNGTSVRSVEAEPFTPMVEVTVGRSGMNRTMLVHLVNTSGCFASSYYEPVPVRDIRLSVPSGEIPADIVDIETGESVPFRFSDGRIFFTVGELKKLTALLVRF